MPETIPISKFKATCLRLLDNVNKTGKSIIVTRNGEPIALV
ncbi:MAG: type II toxin-antitoxin system Phd/YefM family antitoxin, partial [Deltaproteobacteria bacterium]|nr:type II toxin-antitoxin system Phd/YefM family antitoxin [Deltaproteobacteria bacterium]